MTTKASFEDGQFCWVDLMAHDMVAAQEFYGQLFGWQAADMDTQGGPPYAQFTLDGKSVGGLGRMDDALKSQGMPPCWNSYIHVTDLEAVVERAKELGAQITVPPAKVMDEGSLAFFQDPTGGQIGLWQGNQHGGAQLVNEPGSFCWNELATRDVEVAKKFFGELFGWQFEDNPHSPTKYYIIKNNEASNGGLMQMDQQWGDIPAHWMVYFAVADTAASAAKVSQLGGRVHVPPFDTVVGKISVVADPQGANFSLIGLTRPVE